MPSGEATVTCSTHKTGECWVVCDHAVEGKTVARRIPNHPVAGEVLCGDCRAKADASRGTDINDSLNVACGECVKEKFPMEDAS
jgi:hypothetical protein